jgi:hypothetical protein
MGLDRDGHPVRFAIVTSVTSGLMVATIAAIASQFDVSLLVYRVPLWTLVVPLLAAAGIFVSYVVLLRDRKTEAFFVLCALNEKR